MLKKRFIFVLLWDSGHFCLSRNFRLQHVGDLDWLLQSYSFATMADSIDELFLLDVSPNETLSAGFLDVVHHLSGQFHIPLAVGGGIRTTTKASQLFKVGADKIVVNTPLVDDSKLCAEIADIYGQQSLVGSIDWSSGSGESLAYVDSASRCVGPLQDHLQISSELVGEILLNDIQRDGTGFGLDLVSAKTVCQDSNRPVVVMGGCGKPDHIVSGLMEDGINAVATANLFNFVGDGLQVARRMAIEAGIEIPNRIRA